MGRRRQVEEEMKEVSIRKIASGYLVKTTDNRWAYSEEWAYPDLEGVFEKLLRYYEGRNPDGEGEWYGEVSVCRDEEPDPPMSYQYTGAVTIPTYPDLEEAFEKLQGYYEGRSPDGEGERHGEASIRRDEEPDPSTSYQHTGTVTVPNYMNEESGTG